MGILLDLPTGEMKAIEAGWPTNAKWCCNMLEKWLEMDITASWRKLLTVIESLAVSGCGCDQGTYVSIARSYRVTESWLTVSSCVASM